MTHDLHRPPACRRNLARIWLGWCCVFAMTAVAATWPLARQMTTAIPLGWEQVATVPLLNLWTVWWNADRAAVGFTDYWDAPIFYPAEATFIYSESQPTTLVVTPFVWLRGDAILAYNVYLLATLWLNGVLTFRLLREHNYSAWSAGIAGVMTQILPYTTWQLGVLQLVQLWPSLWTISAAWRLLRAPRWRTAFELGLAYAVTYASCNYYGLFLAVLLPPAGLWGLNREWLRLTSWAKLLFAAGVAGCLVAPIVTQQLAQSQSHAWQRDDLTVRGLSAHWRDYSDTPSAQWLEAWEDETPGRHEIWPLGPGWLKLIGAAAGLCLGLVCGGYRRWTCFAITFGLLAAWDSLGPDFAMWNISPFGCLRQYVPGFGQIRSPFRFAVFVQLTAVWFSALLIERLIPRARSSSSLHQDDVDWLKNAGAGTPSSARPPHLVTISLRWGLALLTGACLVAETRPLIQPLYVLPLREPLPPWVEFVRDELPPGVPIACLPMSLGTTVGDYEREAEWMLWGLDHRHPLLNGYSGYFPEEYVALKNQLVEFPNQGVPELLKMGARYAVVRRDFETEAFITQHPSTRDWIWLFGDEQQQIDIYQLPELAAENSAQSARPAETAN